MGPLFYVMAIMGCGDGNADCAEARMVPVRYQSMAECRAALPAQLAANTDVPYPTIGATCRRAGADIVKTEAKTPQG